MNRIGINLLWMVPGVVGGSETYTVRLLSGLAERSSELHYILFALPQFTSAYPELARTFETVQGPMRGRSKPTRVLAGEHAWLALQTRRRDINLIHHAGGVVPLIRPSRPVLTIHDLQYVFYPEYFTRPKLFYLTSMMPRSAENARLILTPSEFTRRTVIERLNIDPSIVVVVPHGIAPHEGKEPSRDVRARYELHDPYFLYPAATYPHKNHLMLADAFSRVVKEHPHVKLVLTGAKGSSEWGTAHSMESRLAEELKVRKIEDSVRHLGYVPTADLDGLYHEACALVFPSRFEGFGAPVLEAMTRGVPVIAANTSALPEVVQNAGLLASPDDPEEWATWMTKMLEDEELSQRFAKAGIERARDFTWSNSADILEDAYRHGLATTL